MPALAPDLQALTDAMTAADRAADALAGRVSDEQFFWQPDGGKRWSIALCLDHLAVANTVYGRAIRGAVDEATARGSRRAGPAAPGMFGRWFVAWLEPPVKHRSSAPAKIVPRPLTSRDEIMRGYHQAHDDIRGLIAAAAAIDVNRATFQNPFISIIRVSVATGLHVVAAHDRRHLWQAEQVELALRSGRG